MVSCALIAHELSIASSLLTRWRREADSASQKAGNLRDEEVASLKLELAFVRRNEVEPHVL